MATKSLIYRFKSGTVVDRTMFNALSNEKLAETMAELTKEGEPTPIFVPNTSEFFSRANLSKELLNQGPFLGMLLEKWGITVSDAELQLIKDFNALKVELTARIDVHKPAYPFAKVPEGFTIEGQFKVTRAGIRRLNGSYSVTQAGLKKVFNKAVKAWAEEKIPSSIRDMQIGGSWRDVTFSMTGVRIGCQSVDRYELEQMGLHLGWEFP
jgi:hypothetical protein